MKKKLFIFIPAYDGKVMIGAANSILHFIHKHESPIDPQIHVTMLPGESHVNRARNRGAKMFLDTDCTHFLFIDSDIGFKSAQIDALLARDLDVIGGLYPKKELGEPQWVVNLIEGNNMPDSTGLIEVRFAGTGFLLVARSVFEKMIEANKVRREKNEHLISLVGKFSEEEDRAYLKTLCEHDDIEYQDDSAAQMGTMWNFFHAGNRDGRWYSEDWHFCFKWRELGGKIYADTRVQLCHTGNIDYPVRPKPLELEIRP